jgi:hypothetical protein
VSTESREPSEEELRAAYEAQVKQVRVEHILLDNVITLANVGMRKTGMAPGTENERDPDQVRVAIESIRALMPMVEQTVPDQIGPIREALSQLQLAFVKIGGAARGTGSEPKPGGGSEPRGPGEPAPEPPKPGEPGPAQRSGRLWVPGQ